MTGPVRLALVGMGKIAHDEHLPAIAADPAFDLVATVSRHGEPVDGRPVFRSVEALADSGLAVDAVALCTPPQVRTRIAAFAIAAGWHVFLEKPPAATLAEAVMLRDSAAARGVGLYASWHSRHAAAVQTARDWLADRTVRSASILWAEDVRHWHPGQDWIFEPGGFGVFDPAINALSIATAILPCPIMVERAAIDMPANRAAAIAATVGFRDARGAPVDARFTFLQQGRQSWDIVVDTDAGVLKLADGGATMAVDDAPADTGSPDLAGEYPALYRRFAEVAAGRTVDMDLAPLRLVADIHLLARVSITDTFDW